MAGASGRARDSLSPQQRSRHYRELADAAFLKAKHVDNPQTRTEYLTLAAAWHALAQEMERGERRLTRTEASPESHHKPGNNDRGPV
jgi:hypothetical protein